MNQLDYSEKMFDLLCDAERELNAAERDGLGEDPEMKPVIVCAREQLYTLLDETAEVAGGADLDTVLRPAYTLQTGSFATGSRTLEIPAKTLRSEMAKRCRTIGRKLESLRQSVAV